MIQIKTKTILWQRYKDINLQTFGPLSRFEHGPTPFLCPSLVMAHRFPLHNKIYEDHTFEKVPTKESCIMFIQWWFVIRKIYMQGTTILTLFYKVFRYTVDENYYKQCTL